MLTARTKRVTELKCWNADDFQRCIQWISNIMPAKLTISNFEFTIGCRCWLSSMWLLESPPLHCNEMSCIWPGLINVTHCSRNSLLELRCRSACSRRLTAAANESLIMSLVSHALVTELAIEHRIVHSACDDVFAWWSSTNCVSWLMCWAQLTSSQHCRNYFAMLPTDTVEIVTILSNPSKCDVLNLVVWFRDIHLLVPSVNQCGIRLALLSTAMQRWCLEW